MQDDAALTKRVLDAFDQTEFTPYSAWSQYHFAHGGSETHEGMAFCAPRSEALNIEQFIAASIFRVFNYAGLTRAEIRDMLAGATILPTQGPLEQCDAWRGLADTRIQGSTDMLAALQAAHPDLKLVVEVFDLDAFISSFAVAENPKSYVALYWYTTG